MRIVHFTLGRCNPDSANGVDKTVYYLSKTQAALGNAVTVFSLTVKSPIPIQGVAVKTYSPKGFPFIPPKPLLRNLFSIYGRDSLLKKVECRRLILNSVAKTIGRSPKFDEFLPKEFLYPQEIALEETKIAVDPSISKLDIFRLEMKKIKMNWEDWIALYRIYKLLSLIACLVFPPRIFLKLKQRLALFPNARSFKAIRFRPNLTYDSDKCRRWKPLFWCLNTSECPNRNSSEPPSQV